MLTKNDILNRPRTIEQVPAPELGDAATLGVRLLSAAEFLKLSGEAKAQPELGYAFWIIATVVDDNGTAMFTDADLEAVTALPFPLVDRLIDKAQKVNGTKKDAASGNS